MHIRGAAVVLIFIILCGCAGFKGVSPGMRFDAGDGVTVTSDVAWANAYGPAVSGYLWTIDGFGLNELRFLTGITPGKPLLQSPGVSAKDSGAYAADMLPNDVMEFVGSTLAKAGNLEVQTATLRPAPFGSTMGFRFDLTFVTKDGLKMRGTVLFAQRRGKLDVLLFDAPEEFYYGHDLPIVESVFRSITIAGNR